MTQNGAKEDHEQVILLTQAYSQKITCLNIPSAVEKH